jgi:hypothetical protein
MMSDEFSNKISEIEKQINPNECVMACGAKLRESAIAIVVENFLRKAELQWSQFRTIISGDPDIGHVGLLEIMREQSKVVGVLVSEVEILKKQKLEKPTKSESIWGFVLENKALTGLISASVAGAILAIADILSKLKH